MRIGNTYLSGLRPRRKAAGMTQAELARAIGTSRQCIRQWETGIVWPSAEWLPKIAAVCGCRMEDLYEADNTDEEGDEDDDG